MAAQIYPYLTFENAKEAMDYYVQNFGATILYHQPLNQQQAEDLGLNLDNLANTTFRGAFSVAGQKLICADATMANPQASSLISIMLDFYDDEGEAKDLFKLLASSDDQRVTIPFGPQNGGQMGQVIDKYGITWIIVTGSLED
ncbi:VOC family protein [Limosilactobacillus frumenti]|uniref:VOC family protein n=1 Tax=Limosilactobacillus frumenti TaxID=104955 RepID=UPI0015EBEB42|nr:VOC family protein [Limosilactobacillus frumenti]MBA2913916.1 VOC family protein [Limosilactobacillus frumenti]